MMRERLPGIRFPCHYYPSWATPCLTNSNVCVCVCGGVLFVLLWIFALDALRTHIILNLMKKDTS